MDKILTELGWSHLLMNFQDNKVGPQEVLALTDHEFLTLGIETIGERAKLRQRCKEEVGDRLTESPMIKRLRMLQSERRGRAGSQSKSKATVRLHIGWKHFTRGSYFLVNASKGGGAQTFDAPKTLSLAELEDAVSSIYFPQGNNSIQGLRLSSVSFYIVFYSGEKLSPFIQGQPFTVELLYNTRKTYPIRIYLHTVEEEKGRDQTCNGELPRDAVTCTSADTENVEGPTPREEAENRIFCISSDESYNERENDSDDELPSIDSGTPTIVFNTRLNVQNESLHHHENNHAEPFDQQDNHDQSSVQLEDDSLQSILQSLARDVSNERTNLVNVSRDDVLPGALRAFQRKTFVNNNLLSVKFAGEYAIDEGGPTREFLRLLMVRVRDMPIFCGPDDAKHLDLSYPDLQKGTYEIVGKMCSYSIVHGGPSPAFLSSSLYSAIASGIDSVTPTIHDVMDHEYKEDTEGAETVSEYEQELVQMAGCMTLAVNIAKKDELCQAVTHFVVLGRISQCIDQFCRGLATLGVLNAVRTHQDRMAELFQFEQRTLDNNTIMAIFEPVFSLEGSNANIKEKVVHSNWLDVVLDIEEGEEDVGLRHILTFATGADQMPTLGFHPQPKLVFHAAGETEEDSSNFPYANTCSNVLSLPLIKDYVTFKRNVLAAIAINFFSSE